MRAIAFVLSSLETGRLIAHALVAPEARYASRLPAGADRLERLFAPLALWRAIESDLTLGLPPGPIEADSALCRLLVPDGWRRSMILQRLAEPPVTATVPHEVAPALDALLKGLAGV